MPVEQKYARIEWERRFLLDCFPLGAVATRVRHISDRYIEGTTLRLRQQSDSDGQTVFKLTQKLPDKGNGARQGFITSIYLTNVEFGVLAKLPARVLTKTRHSVPPFGIDVFDGVLSGLVLAEAEFSSAAEQRPWYCPPSSGMKYLTTQRSPEAISLPRHDENWRIGSGKASGQGWQPAGGDS